MRNIFKKLFIEQLIKDSERKRVKARTENKIKGVNWENRES